jgi:hypothetical protein
VERVLAYVLQNAVVSVFPFGKQHGLIPKMCMLNRMLLIENLYLKFCIINSRSHQWIHEINTQRGIHGKFHHLYRELRGHPQRFFEYIGMSISRFNVLLSQLERHLSKETTSLRKPISPTERLVTLR